MQQVVVCLCVGVVSTELKSSSVPLSLGEQAASLREPQERLLALRRVTSTAQILLAYSMVMRALSQTSTRYLTYLSTKYIICSVNSFSPNLTCHTVMDPSMSD